MNGLYAYVNGFLFHLLVSLRSGYEVGCPSNLNSPNQAPMPGQRLALSEAVRQRTPDSVQVPRDIPYM